MKLIAYSLFACALLGYLSAGAAEIPVRKIHALTLTDQNPELYYRDSNGEYQRFHIGNIQRGPEYLVPALKTLRLYIPGVDQAGNSLMKPVLEIPIPKSEGMLLLVFYYDESGQTRYELIQDNIIRYPAGTVRFVNLSPETIYCILGEEQIKVPPGEATDKGILIDNPQSFTFTYGSVQLDGSLYKAPLKKLRLPHSDMRLMILFSSRYEPNGDQAPILKIRDVRIYDRVTPEF